METYSRLECEIAEARSRTRQLRREAAEQRLIGEARGTTLDERADTRWRARLAAQLYALAERLEPQPERRSHKKRSHV